MRNIDKGKLREVISRHEEGLRRLEKMWNDPKVLFYEDSIPKHPTKSVFLFGPTSRDGVPDYMWRKDQVFFLRHFGFKGIIFVPESRGYSYLVRKGEVDFTDSQKIYTWEHDAGIIATYKSVWIPRNTQQLLALTTNRELGQLLGRAEYDKKLSDNLFIGWPEDAVKMGSMNYELIKARVGCRGGSHFKTLEDLCREIAVVSAI